MDAHTIRKVPWTCQWARFTVAVEQTDAGESRVDDVFWGCHHPVRAPDLRLMKRGECEQCPFWEMAHRLGGKH